MSRGGRSSGKRRGDNALTFSLESMGLSRSETLPPPTLLPPPLYPPLDLKPIPLKNNEVDLYLLTLKQEFRLSLTTSKYFINPVKEKPKIERYSDKYENTVNKSVVNDNPFEFDWRLFPSELCPQKKRRLADKPKKQIIKDINKKLENLTAKENEEKTDDEKSDHELDENENELDEEKGEELVEDIEEGTDYTFSYFDNGENYLEDSDDNQDEGPTY